MSIIANINVIKKIIPVYLCQMTKNNIMGIE